MTGRPARGRRHPSIRFTSSLSSSNIQRVPDTETSSSLMFLTVSVSQFPSTSQLWSDSIHREKLDILYIEIKHIFQAAIVVYERLKNSFLLNNTLRPEARRLAALRPADLDMKKIPCQGSSSHNLTRCIREFVEEGQKIYSKDTKKGFKRRRRRAPSVLRLEKKPESVGCTLFFLLSSQQTRIIFPHELSLHLRNDLVACT